MEIEDKLREIQTRISQETAKKARAQVLTETADKNLEQARTQLEQEFGVTSGAEIAAKLAELNQELKDELNLAEAALNNSYGE